MADPQKAPWEQDWSKSVPAGKAPWEHDWSMGVPKGDKPATLPNVTNEDMSGWGKTALHALPAVAATGAAIFQPELLPVAGGFLSELGAATGLAAAGGAAGSAVEQGTELATGMEERPRSFGEFSKRLGKEAAYQGGMEAGGRLVAKPFSFIGGIVKNKLNPSALMQGAIKPTTTAEAITGRGIPGTSVPEMMETTLREKILPTKQGYTKLIGHITELTKQIDAAVAAKSPQLGSVISPKTVASRLDALIDFYEAQAAPAEDLAAIKGVRDQFLSRHSEPFIGPLPQAYRESSMFGSMPLGEPVPRPQVETPMTLSEAQAEKRGTQRFNANKFGERGTARDEAEKSLAFSLKEQIVGLFPELQALNARDSSMLALEDQLRRMVIRQGNKNVLGLVPAMGAATSVVTGMLGGSTGEEAGAGGGAALLTAAIMMMDNPEVKGKLALALYKAGKSRLGNITVKAGARLGKELPAVAGRALAQ